MLSNVLSLLHSPLSVSGGCPVPGGCPCCLQGWVPWGGLCLQCRYCHREVTDPLILSKLKGNLTLVSQDCQSCSVLLHPTALKPAWLWWDWWYLSHKHVTVPVGMCMEPHSQRAGGAVGTSDSTVWGRCLRHGLLLGHGHCPQCGCQ